MQKKWSKCQCDCDLPDFSTFPMKFKTVMRHFASWNVGKEYDEYCACENHHLRLRSDLEGSHTRICNAKLRNGNECGLPFFKEVNTKHGHSRLEPLKSLMYRGFRRPLEQLFKQDGGYNANQWRDLPDVSPAVCDFYTSQLWRDFTPFFEKLEGRNILLWLSVDW